MVSYSNVGARGLSLQSMSNQLFLLLEEAYSLSDSFRDKRKEEFKNKKISTQKIFRKKKIIFGQKLKKNI